MRRILICSDRSWTERLELSERLLSEVDVYYARTQPELEDATAKGIMFDFIFFPFWSRIIDESIYAQYKAVIFHMTDLPHGRGGSPLQNLILEGATSTKISAIECAEVLDGGAVYLKKPLSLEGSAQDIFERAVPVISEMIEEIVYTNPLPTPQSGTATRFRRRKPEQSSIPFELTSQGAYDFIRMLDAETYPKAFIRHGTLKIVFSEARLIGDELTVKAVIEEEAK